MLSFTRRQMLLKIFLFQVPAVHLFEQYLECTETQWHQLFQLLKLRVKFLSRISSSGCFHRGYGFIQSRAERLCGVAFVCVADLHVLVDHPCDLLSLAKAFFFFLTADSPFEVSVGGLFQITRYFRIKNLQVCLQLCPGDNTRRLQIGHRLREFHLVHPHQCFDRTTCTRGCFTSETHSHDPETSEFTPGSELKFFSFRFLGNCVSLSVSTCSGSSTVALEFVVAVRVSPGTCSTVRTVEMDKQAVTRCNTRTRLLHPFN